MDRIAALQGADKARWEDELYSDEALTNLAYRDALEAAYQAAAPLHKPYIPPKPRKQD